MTVRTLTHTGLTLTVREWAKLTGHSPRIIYWRLSQGWSVEDALTSPKWKRVTVSPSAQLETEFHKLVCSIDGALRVYRKHVGSLMLEELDPGVGRNIAKSRRDRCPRVAQESA
ncbi:hypothetical protein ACM42_12665 [Bradyrhizobium sp. CCBAU 25338]|nr:hypothetical protein [Bradyrhizobium sp. CCBAU 25338]